MLIAIACQLTAWGVGARKYDQVSSDWVAVQTSRFCRVSPLA